MQSTAENLIKAARYLFSRFGFKGVSVRQICDKAGCNLASISYHFQGKDELYRQCLEKNMSKNTEKFQQILTPPRNREDFEAKLHLFTYEFYAHMVERADIVRIVMHEMHDPSPVGQEVMEKLHQQIPLLLMQFVEKASEKGLIKPDVDPKTIIDFIFSTCTSQILFEEHVKKIYNIPAGISDPGTRKRMIDQIMLIMSGGIYAD